jgi:hypothetical protein
MREHGDAFDAAGGNVLAHNPSSQTGLPIQITFANIEPDYPRLPTIARHTKFELSPWIGQMVDHIPQSLRSDAQVCKPGRARTGDIVLPEEIDLGDG